MSRDMENISRNNYEVWVIDYLDGNLDKEKERLFLHFMDRNPDLKKEFDMMRPVTLYPEKVSFDKKHLLFKSTNPDFDMPESDYLMIKELEEGLTSDENKRLNALKETYPALKKDAEIYKSVKLQPEKIVYLHKDALRKTNRVLRIMISIGSVAAAVLLFFMLIPWNNFSRTDAPIILSSNSEPVIENTTEIPQINNKIGEKTETPEIVKENNQYIAQSVKNDEIEEAAGDEIFIRQEAIASIFVSHDEPLPQLREINVYEMGLNTMIPQYIDNMRLLEAYIPYEVEDENPYPNSILQEGLKRLTRIIPFGLRRANEENNLADATPILEFTRRQ